MFSENKKLSSTGIKKLVITIYLGIALLFSGYFAKTLDFITGSFILTFMLIFSLVYEFLILHLIHTEKYKKKFLQFFLHIKMVTKSILLASFAALFFIKFIHEFLLPNTNTVFLCLFIFLSAFYVSRHEIEIRSRLCEIIYPFILLPLFIVLLTGIFRIDYHSFFSTLKEISVPDYSFTAINLLKLFLISFFSFIILCPADFLLLKPDFFHKEIPLKKRFQILLFPTLFIYAISLLQLFISSMLMEENQEPEFLFSICICISLFLYIGTCMHYGTKSCVTLCHRFASKMFYYVILLAFSIFLLLYPGYLKSSYLHSYLTKTGFDTLYQPSCHILDARELENRSFVLSMIVTTEKNNSDNTMVRLICEIASYNSDSQASSEYIYLSKEISQVSSDADYFSELLNSFPLSGGKPLDFSHIEAVILNLYEEKDVETFLSTAITYRLPKDTLIFQKKDFPKTYKMLTEKLDSINLGEVLTTLAKNQKIEKSLMLRHYLTNYQ